jgi:hypothetical protein
MAMQPTSIPRHSPHSNTTKLSGNSKPPEPRTQPAGFTTPASGPATP